MSDRPLHRPSTGTDAALAQDLRHPFGQANFHHHLIGDQQHLAGGHFGQGGQGVLTEADRGFSKNSLIGSFTPQASRNTFSTMATTDMAL